jgi:phosphoserine aminotransferase
MKYFTVGPTQMHEKFKSILDDALTRDLVSVSHRSKWFVDMYFELTANTKKLFGAPHDYETVFLGSATECMERAIQNMSTKETLHFVSGSFGARCATFAEAAGREVTVVKSRADGAFYVEDIPKDIAPEAIFFTHSETNRERHNEKISLT